MMKKILLILGVLLCFSPLYAQSIEGDWYGKMEVMKKSLRLNFHITNEVGTLSATMDSPDQGVKNISINSVIYENGILTLKVGNITYTASLHGTDSLVGIFQQANIKTDLNMTHNPIEAVVEAKPKRYQTPVPPFKYSTNDVVFKGAGDYQLAGTLTLPKKMKSKTPIVVLISGSGPQDRDETLLDHKPFAVIADALARNGIASLRYDDRGTAKSTGDFKKGTSHDNILDAQAAISFLRNKGYTNIGALGHSEGGLIVAELSAQDPDLKFIISLAGTGVNGVEIIKKQTYDINTADNASEETMALSKNTALLLDKILAQPNITPEQAKKILEQHYANISDDLIKSTELSKQDFMEIMSMQLCDPWMLYFLQYDPQQAWKNVHCRVLALNGEKDLQVNYEINLSAIRNAVGDRVELQTKSYADLNHLFQHATTGSPSEYESIEETISPEVLSDIVDFIKGKSVRADNSD